MSIKLEIGKQIKKLRIDNGYTQEKLSELIGISQRALSSIESGKNFISAETLENLLKILGKDTRIVTIFLKVGKEELKRRLIERGDNIQDIEVRLGRLEYEEDKIKLYDYVIKNDDFEKTVQVIMTIIENEKRIEDECV